MKARDRAKAAHRRAARLADVTSLKLAFAQAIRPPPNVTVSQWADRYRMLTSSQAANPGPWRTDKVEYLRDIMDAASPMHPAKRIVVQKSRRGGFTEGVINNTIGAFMHMAPCPILVGQPTESDAEEWSKDSFDPMCETTPYLRRLITPDSARRKGNTILHKRYRGGALYARSASTAKSFRRILARLVLGDEIDAYVANVDGEGSTTKLMEGRADTFTHNKKVILGSTPTIKGQSAIETEYLQSTMGKYHVPCPDCGHLQELVWEQVRWTDDDPTTAEYACINCGVCIPHRMKARMISRKSGAKWIHQYPERETLGFHFSALYSPWVSWKELVTEWLAAQGDPTKEQVFINTSLGLTWDLMNAEKWDDEGFRSLLMPLAVVPAGAAVLTAGVDVQRDKIVLQVDAWGEGEERWTIERRDLLGDPSDPTVWRELRAALRQRYPIESGGTVPIRATCIDTGDRFTQAAWDFCKVNHSMNVWGIKGSHIEGARVWPREKRFRNKGGYSPIMVGVSTAKEVLHARLKRSMRTALANVSMPASRRAELGGPAFWHFSDTLTEHYFDELTAEVQVVIDTKSKTGGRGTPRRKWVLRESGRRNEALDISVYSYAALEGLLASNSVRLGRPLRGSHSTPRSDPQDSASPKKSGQPVNLSKEAPVSASPKKSGQPVNAPPKRVRPRREIAE